MGTLNSMTGNVEIRPDGLLQDDRDGSLETFSFDAGDFKVWFEVHYKFVGDGNEFYVEICKFGFKKRVTAHVMDFDKDAVKKIKGILQSYFMGDEPKQHFPFKRSRCLGVIFRDNWINGT